MSNTTLITGEELAEKIGVKYQTLMYRAKNGDIPSLKYSHRRLFQSDQVDFIKTKMAQLKTTAEDTPEILQEMIRISRTNLSMTTKNQQRLTRLECKIHEIYENLTAPKLGDKFTPVDKLKK